MDKKKPYAAYKKKKQPGGLGLNRVEKSPSRTCQTCEFNADDTCIIHGEGYKGREANTCNDWGISSSAFARQEKRNKR